MPIGFMPPLPSFLFSAIALHAKYGSSDFGSTNSVHILLPRAAKDSQRPSEALLSFLEQKSFFILFASNPDGPEDHESKEPLSRSSSHLDSQRSRDGLREEYLVVILPGLHLDQSDVTRPSLLCGR